MFYLIGTLLILIALTFAIVAPKNLWDTWLGTVGLVVLLYAFARSPRFADQPAFAVLLQLLAIIVQYIAPIFVLIAGLFMVTAAITLYQSEESRVQLTFGIGLAFVLITIGILSYYFMLFGNFFDRFRWVHSVDYVLAYYFLIMVNFLLNTLKLWLFEDESRQDYVIILGGRTHADGSLTTLVKNRLDTALHYLERQRYYYGHVPTVIVSGTNTMDSTDVTEARVMADYLEENGVDASQLLLEEQAANTHQNFIYSRRLIAERERNLDAVHAIFITNTFHLYRSQLYSNMVGMYQWQGYGATATLRQWMVNGFREYVAIIFMHRKFNFAVTVLLLVFGISRFL